MEYPEGWDCTWAAVDSNGYVGVFATAGKGPIPTTVTSHHLDRVGELIDSLPRACKANALVKNKNYAEWVAMAECGLFAYDWSDVHRIKHLKNGYELIAAPFKPVFADQLGDAFGKLLAPVRFTGLNFSEHPVLDIRPYIACLLPQSE